MQHDTWELDDLPPSTRRKVVAAAERSGLGVGEYLINLLTQPPADAAPPLAPVLARQRTENFAYRHRLEALERRVGVSTAGLEVALRTLEASTLSLDARVSDAECAALDAQEAVREATLGLAGELSSAQKRLGRAEQDGLARQQSAEAAHFDFAARLSRFDQQLDFVEDIANGAHQTGTLLAEANHALKHAVAEDFAALALDTAANIDGGLQAIREDSEAAAARADAALQALVREFRDFAATTEGGIAAAAAESRERMRAAFAETASQVAALTDRMIDNQRSGALACEMLATQLAALAEINRSSLGNAVAELRQADAALQAALSRSSAEQRSAIDTLNARIAAEFEMRDQRIAGRLDRVESAQNIASSALGDTLARVEACTLAALEKLAADIALNDVSLTQGRADTTATAHAVEHLEGELASLHGQHCGVAARLHLIDRTLGMASLAHESDPPVAERLAELEQTQAEQQLRLGQALDRSSVNRELASLRGDIVCLDERIGDAANDVSVAQHLDDLRLRIDAQTAQNTDLARTLSRVSAKGAGASALAEDRLRKLEQAARTGGAERIAAQIATQVENRISEIEARQGEALEQIRADIARFIEQQERRCAAIEANDPNARLEALAALIERRPPPPTAPDFVAEFDTLRQRLEARIHDMDGRNIRTLEQVSETIALLEQRFNSRSQQRAASGA